MVTNGGAGEIAEALDELRALQANLERGAPVAPRRVSREMLEPILPRLGISRVGSLTGLDPIDIPVWFAVRPLSRGLCVSGGKGLTDEAAWISAVMESAEQAFAEDAPGLIRFVASRHDVSRRGLRSVDLGRQTRCGESLLPSDTDMAWVEGLSLKTGETVFAPYELVGMDMAAAAPWNAERFYMSSVGLAAAGDLTAAITHGLSELIEDDASFACMAGGPPRTSRKIIFDRHRSDDLAWVLNRLAEQNVEARFADVADDNGMPVIMAALRSGGAKDAGLSYFCGSACRATVEGAALAALLEAVQTRVIFVSGARDDLYARDYGQRLTPGTAALFGGYEFGYQPTSQRLEPSDLHPLEALLAAVYDSGIPDVYVFPLGGCHDGIQVVRVLADDLVTFQGASLHPRSGRAGIKLMRQWFQT